jgi:hypothetical protein
MLSHTNVAVFFVLYAKGYRTALWLSACPDSFRWGIFPTEEAVTAALCCAVVRRCYEPLTFRLLSAALQALNDRGSVFSTEKVFTAAALCCAAVATQCLDGGG